MFDSKNDQIEKTADDASTTVTDITVLARQAVDSIRKAADEFAERAGVTTDDAANAARQVANATAQGLGNLAGEARVLGESGLEAIGKSVNRNPVAALAIAAGAGLVLGLLSRSDSKR